MPDTPRKEPFKCPHCGFVQNEPRHLISTYCRGCGSYYEVTPERRAESVPVTPASARHQRTIHCFRCGRDHGVSNHARSTICPGCSTAIELDDLVFSGNVSRPVDTRGLLHITAKGYLNNAFIICGEGRIEGRLSGTLHCVGTLRIHASGVMSCQITAHSVIIEKGASVEMIRPIRTADLQVYGRASGQFSCTGKVKIAKGGLLEGKLLAKSVAVERGGNLLAESSIMPRSSGKSPPDNGMDNLTPQPVF